MDVDSQTEELKAGISEAERPEKERELDAVKRKLAGVQLDEVRYFEAVDKAQQVWRTGRTGQFLLASLKVERFRRGWMGTPAFAMVPGEPDAVRRQNLLDKLAMDLRGDLVHLS